MWKQIEFILSNHNWKLTNLPPGSRPIEVSEFSKKIKSDESINKYKAKLVAKDYRQKEGLDYFDTYSSESRIMSIWMLIAIAVLHNLDIHQMDVKTAFLNGDLNEETYVEQRKGFIVKVQEHKV